MIVMELNQTKIQLEMGRLGWTKSDLARRMNKSRQHIHHILSNGSKGFTLRTIQALADALGLDPKDLIK